jgi:uncharacterized membrane protein
MERSMNTTRLEAFSDGVLAIIVTVMVLDLKAPEHLSVRSLAEQLPNLLGYVLSFTMVSIVWVNHHHVFQLVRRVDARVLWLNNHLLLWVSLVPFATALVGRNGTQGLAAMVYGVVMLGSASAFTLLRHVVAKHAERRLLDLHRTANLRNAVGLVLYAVSVPLAWWRAWAAYGIFVAVAAMYFVPERRIEAAVRRAR